MWKAKMLDGSYIYDWRKLAELGEGAVTISRRGNTIYVWEGHHRINAALEIGKKTGDWSYLRRVIEGAYVTDLPHHAQPKLFPTRGFWNKILKGLGF